MTNEIKEIVTGQIYEILDALRIIEELINRNENND